MNEHTIPLPTDNPMDVNPKTWLETAQKFFVSLGSQAATEVVASYQTAKLLGQRLRYEREYSELSWALDVIKDAAKTRMHYLVACTEARAERRRLRKLFGAATSSSEFWSIWDWVL